MRKYIVIFAIFVLMSCPCFAEVTAPEYVDNEQKIKSVPDTLTCLGNGYYSVKGEDGQTYQFATKEEEGVEMVDHFVPIGQLPADIVQSIMLDDYLKRVDEFKKKLDDDNVVNVGTTPKQPILPNQVDKPEWVDDDYNGYVYFRYDDGNGLWSVWKYYSGNATSDILISDQGTWNNTYVRFGPVGRGIRVCGTSPTNNGSYLHYGEEDDNGDYYITFCRTFCPYGDPKNGTKFQAYSPYYARKWSASAAKSLELQKCMDYVKDHKDDFINQPDPVDDVGFTQSDEDIQKEIDEGLIPYTGGEKYTYFNVNVMNYDELVEALKKAGFGSVHIDNIGDNSQYPDDLGSIDWMEEEQKEDSWIIKLFKAIAKFFRSLIIPDDVEVQNDDGTTTKENFFTHEFRSMHKEFKEKVKVADQAETLYKNLTGELESYETNDIEDINVSGYFGMSSQPMRMMAAYEAEDEAAVCDNGISVLNLEGVEMKVLDFSFMNKQAANFIKEIILLLAWLKFIIGLPKRIQKLIKG